MLLSNAACAASLVDLSGTEGHQYCVDDPGCSKENADFNAEQDALIADVLTFPPPSALHHHVRAADVSR